MKRFMIAILLMMASTTLYADDVDNFFEVGADVMVYNDYSDVSDLDTDLTLSARLGVLGNTGLYAWGSYEQPTVSILGNKTGHIRMFSLGGGYRLPLAENWYALVETGYYMPAASNKLNPLSYDDNWGGSVGVGYDINENFTLNTKYRYLKVNQDGVGDERVDMSAYSVGLSYRF